MERELDIIFADSPDKLLKNVRTKLKSGNLEPISLDIVREFNNFCAVVVSKKIEDFIE